MKAFQPYSSKSTTEHGFTWLCPGCGEMHSVPIGGHPRTNWKWNGDLEKPTFSPSVRVRWSNDGDHDRLANICHFFIRAGVADFCGDCTHEHAGKKLEVVSDPERS